jgi:hypothetical protein
MTQLITSRSPIAFLVLVVTIQTDLAAAQDLTTEPNQVRLEVSDVRRLARVLRTTPASDRAASIERDYLAQASPGLQRYATEYKVTGASLAAALARRPEPYADLDRAVDAVLALEPALRSAFQKLKDLFPAATFPPIWFVAGHFAAGGMIEREGVVIGLEMFASNLDGIVPIVMHELAHFQSAMALGPETYLRAIGPEGTLLSRALREGSAELFAQLTAGQHINPAAERYGLQHESELWARFQKEMARPETGDWMFVRPSNRWPQDLGYWMGYRIAKSYFDRAENKPQAVQEILNLTDFVAFLKASRYAEQFR